AGKRGYAGAAGPLQAKLLTSPVSTRYTPTQRRPVWRRTSSAIRSARSSGGATPHASRRTLSIRLRLVMCGQPAVAASVTQVLAGVRALKRRGERAARALPRLDR